MNFPLPSSDLDGPLALCREVPALQVRIFVLEGVDLLSLASILAVLETAKGVLPAGQLGWTLQAPSGGEWSCAGGLQIASANTVEGLSGIDICLVCGGSGVPPESPDLTTLLLRLAASGVQIGGVGSGVFVLAKAGLLIGRDFCVHWADQEAFRRLWPDLVPMDASFCADGQVITAPGGPTAANLMLRLLRDTFGPMAAAQIMTSCGLPSHRLPSDPQTAMRAARYRVDQPRLAEVLDYLAENAMEISDISEIGVAIGISVRQIQRLFKVHIGVSPVQYLQNLRLDTARRQLMATDLAVEDIARASGFLGKRTFAKRFRQRFGHSPNNFSQF